MILSINDRGFDNVNLDIEGGSTGNSSGALKASSAQAESKIGSSKTESLFEKISSTSLRSVGYGDSKPLVTKKLPEAKGSAKNSWFDLEVKYPVQARLDDTERISKLLLKLQGIKWEGHTAALETIQNNLEASRINPAESTMAARSDSKSKFGAGIVDTLKSAGLSLVSAAGFTASTLAQVAASGTGEHQEPFLGRSYLRKGSVKSGYGFDVLNSLISSLGFGGIGNVSGASKAQAGVEVEGHAAYTLVQEGNSGHGTHGFSRVQPSRLTELKAGEEYRRTTKEESSGSVGYYSSSFKDSESEAVYLKSPESQDFSVLETVRRRTADPTKNLNTFTDNGGKLEWSRESVYSRADSYTSDLPSGSVVRNQGIKGNSLGKPDSARAFTILSTEPKAYADFKVLKGLGAEDDAEDVFQSQFNLIPFEIQSVMPTEKYVLHFQANLDSYDDSFSADWQASSYVGRADKFYTYGGFTRDINFSFKAVALQESYLHPIYTQLNLLAANTAPTYGDGVFMKGTLARITIGELLNRQYGFIKNIKMSWDTEVPWEIVDFRVPHMLSVSVSFTPLHNFNPTATSTAYFGKE